MNISLVVVTKNRWEVCLDSLQRSGKLLPEGTELVLVDDASDSKLTAEIDWGGPVKRIRRETSVGLVAARNEGNLAAQHELILTLDDDSWIVDGDVKAAAEFLTKHSELAGLTFPVRRLNGEWQAKVRTGFPCEVRAFIGCGHLMKRSSFLRAGGYDESLFRQCEETDLSLRQRLRSEKWMQWPDLTICHGASPLARDRRSEIFFQYRNKALIVWRYCPRYYLARDILTSLCEAVVKGLRGSCLRQSIRGWLSGQKMGFQTKEARPLRRSDYRQWKSLKAY